MISKTKVNLGITQETLFIPLWARAVELEQENPIIKDPKSAQILQEIDYDFNKFAKAKSTQAGCCLRGLILDNWVRNYLQENPIGPIVEIGAGLNTRFERVDNGEVRWFDLDLPDSMAVRQQFFEETERRHFISASALDTDWIERVKAAGAGQPMFVAEGVLMYLSEEQVKQLFANLLYHFPGSWLAFDSLSPFMVKNQKHHDSLKYTSAKFDWGIQDIRLLKNWDSRYEVIEVYTYRDLLTEYQRRFSLFNRLISLLPLFNNMYRVALIRLG
ncbi:MAG TPA: class I SAM-dependent methyltransferase [Coleofasciculaceae cyanobacterium]|jgi:O-methyltransferase involved in polyketide biosynthesis